jgi:hypothetical protein
MPFKDVERKREYQNNWVKAKRQQPGNPVAKTTRRRITSIYRKYYALKASLSCERCGFSHPAALTFHHIDPLDKKMPVANMVGGGYTWSQIEKEMQKCIVLCANCHAMEHWDEGRWIDKKR